MEIKEMKILIFNLGNEYYGADISCIERILEYTKPTQIPGVPDFVEGVINYEGNVIPILNLCGKFNIGSRNEKSGETKIIVVKRENKKFGVVVSNVCEVLNITGDMFQEAPEITLSEAQRYLKGLVKMDKRIIILLDLGRVLSKDEEDKIF